MEYTYYGKTINCMNHIKLWSVHRKMRIPEYLIVFMQNLYMGMELTLWMEHSKIDSSFFSGGWIGNNYCGIKIGERNIKNLHLY